MMYEHVGEDMDSGFWILDAARAPRRCYMLCIRAYDSLKKQQLESTSPKKK